MITLAARLAITVAMASGVTYALEYAGVVAALLVWIALDAMIGIAEVEE